MDREQARQAVELEIRRLYGLPLISRFELSQDKFREILDKVFAAGEKSAGEAIANGINLANKLNKKASR